MSRHNPPIPAPSEPWILVSVLILGTGVLGSALLAGSFTLLVIGVVLTLPALAYTVALTRR